MPVKKALDHYTKMIDDAKSGDIYELPYINGRHLQRIGDDLLKANRTADAILYLDYFVTKYRELSGFHILLAKAHWQNNANKKAIAILEHALTEIFEEDKAEVVKVRKNSGGNKKI
jgi:tetratricopeptide (TPR) repeat protein